MARIVAGVATSHVPAIGAAIDNQRTQEPYWAPLFQGYAPSKRWIADLHPEVVILVGFSRESAERFAENVELAGYVTNPYGVRNEETMDHPDIFVCRGFKRSWPEFWKKFQRFG